MKFVHAALAGLIAVALAGCFPPSTSHPVGLTAGLKADPALVGTWKGPGDDGKIPTYKDGVAFSRVKPDAKVCPAAYDRHAPQATPAPTETNHAEEEPEGEFEESAEDDSTREADEVDVAIAKIRAAESYPAAKQHQTTLAKTDAYKEATLERKAGVRLALWTRYVELRDAGSETVQPFEDFSLARMFLEFGAKDEAEVDEMWAKFWRHAAYKNAGEGDRKAITDLMLRRKAELKEG